MQMFGICIYCPIYAFSKRNFFCFHLAIICKLPKFTNLEKKPLYLLRICLLPRSYLPSTVPFVGGGFKLLPIPFPIIFDRTHEVNYSYLIYRMHEVFKTYLTFSNTRGRQYKNNKQKHLTIPLDH